MTLNNPDDKVVEAYPVSDAVDAQLLDTGFVEELAAFLLANKTNLTRALVIREIQERTVKEAANRLTGQLNALEAEVVRDGATAHLLLATSPALYRKADKRNFQDSATHLARDLRNRNVVVQEMKDTKPSQREAWSAVVASMVQATAHRVNGPGGILSNWKVLTEAINDVSNSSNKVRVGLGVMGENIYALSGEIRALGDSVQAKN